MISTALTASVAEAAVSYPAHMLDMELQANLRERFPDVTIVVCSDDDIITRVPAAYENERCRLFYLDTSNHCIEISSDAETASGIVVCLLSDDD